MSPSLEGVIRHDSMVYEGIHRPEELLRIMDGPASKGPKGSRPKHEYSEKDQQIIEQYFQDLYGVFVKKLSRFALEIEVTDDESLKLQAFLQELIKLKRLMRERFTIEH
ncbi:MAG: hypothetical protein KBC33_03280 [Candidatus Pacebacteria bacterium]|nr:hypothetical protein [Candidatus Paceibacterota bacterium]